VYFSSEFDIQLFNSYVPYFSFYNLKGALFALKVDFLETYLNISQFARDGNFLCLYSIKINSSLKVSSRFKTPITKMLKKLLQLLKPSL